MSLEVKSLVEEYISKGTWRVKENSNSPYSYGALGRYVLGEVYKEYWLTEVYDQEISKAHKEGMFHIHDLGGLTVYCCGYSLRQILLKGVQGVPVIPVSKPAKHFGAALNQIANLTTVFQNEIVGAVAFSSFDTLLAPYVKEDALSFKQVYQEMQNFIFSINSNSRGGAEPAFSNLTFDLTPPDDLLNEAVIFGGKQLDYTYAECQEEMDLINRAFFELMIQGDGDGKPFAYPIPTYNIHKRFDWDNPNNDRLWEMAGKDGTPYFANFLNSDMDPSEARSMCCRLRLDKRELLRRAGGLFGSGDSTGSIGVVTMNLPRLAFESAGSPPVFFDLLRTHLELAKDSLEIKRAFLNEQVLQAGLLPAFSTYVGTLDNHFSTIGYVGLNEACTNLMGEDDHIQSVAGKAFALEVLEFMRDHLQDFQERTGNLYNLEATPAESTSYRLARKDRRDYPDVDTQGTERAPYYTNSCHIPVSDVTSIYEMAQHQDDLQVMHTGGTVMHCYLEGPIAGESAKTIIKQLCHDFKMPYISLSPVNCFCGTHGMLDKKYLSCPQCGAPTELYQRITGYRRNVANFNEGKLAEFHDRNQFRVDNRAVQGY